ncbi:MAG: RluA family pseudouridine synthase [Rickettsiales bacterium]|jgi:23S rRNA pseudouridine1911/1915/1917 synthase|nr:RluA family pseudouridine synthase [Rickettsiales bacterium]
MRQTFAISENDAGIRVDKFLAGQIPNFSRGEIQKMQKNFDNSRKLKTGDVVEIEIPELTTDREPSAEKNDKLPADSSKLSIIFEDDDIIAIDKPRGMVMYPAAGNKTGTLTQELQKYCVLSKLGGDIRPGVVHRIDKNTSGVVVLAKTDIAFRALVKTFSEHKLIRKYIAFVWGVPTWTTAEIEGNIARNSRNRKKMSMVKSGGRIAKTSAEVINVWTRAGVSELRCTLFTGRTHQIRVHLSAHGMGVLTDPLYGRGKESKIKPGPLLYFLRGHTGQCLHAETLELNHPITGTPLKFRAPLPDDLKELKETLDNY